MTRSTDSRRARNSASLTIGARRRPASRPSRRRCFLASRRVEPGIEVISSSAERRLRTRVTVFCGSSAPLAAVLAGTAAAPAAARRRALARPSSPPAARRSAGLVGLRRPRRTRRRRRRALVVAVVAGLAAAAAAAAATAARRTVAGALALLGVVARRARRRGASAAARRPSAAFWLAVFFAAVFLAGGLLGGGLLGRLRRPARRGRLGVLRPARRRPARRRSCGSGGSRWPAGGRLEQHRGGGARVGRLGLGRLRCGGGLLRGGLLGGRPSSRRPSWPAPSWRRPSSPAAASPPARCGLGGRLLGGGLLGGGLLGRASSSRRPSWRRSSWRRLRGRLLGGLRSRWRRCCSPTWSSSGMCCTPCARAHRAGRSDVARPEYSEPVTQSLRVAATPSAGASPGAVRRLPRSLAGSWTTRLVAVTDPPAASRSGDDRASSVPGHGGPARTSSGHSGPGVRVRPRRVSHTTGPDAVTLGACSGSPIVAGRLVERPLGEPGEQRRAGGSRARRPRRARTARRRAGRPVRRVAAPGRGGCRRRARAPSQRDDRGAAVELAQPLLGHPLDQHRLGRRGRSRPRRRGVRGRRRRRPASGCASSRSAREPPGDSTTSSTSSPSGSASSSRAWIVGGVDDLGEPDLDVLRLAGRPGRRGAGVRDPRVRVEARRVGHRHPGPEDRPLEGPAEVAVAGEPEPAALGVADPQPLDGRGLLLGLVTHRSRLRRRPPASSQSTGRPCSPGGRPASAVSRSASASSAARRVGADVLEQVEHARRRRGPAPSSRRSGRPTTRWCRRCRWCRRASGRAGRGRSRAPSSPSPSGRAPAAAPPTARPRRSGSRSSGSTQPVAPPSRPTSTAPTSASAARTAALVEPSHQTMSASVPGPKRRQPAARPARRTPRAPWPARARSPSQVSIAVHCGRAVRQWPALRPRTILASTPSWVSTRGATETLAAYVLPGADARAGRRARRPARAAAGRRARRRPRAGRAWPPRRRRARRRRRRRGRPARPPWPAGPGARAATRAEALPHAAGSRSRGNTNSVRRIASCLTRVRSSYSARSTSATVSPSTRAHSER